MKEERMQYLDETWTVLPVSPSTRPSVLRGSLLVDGTLWCSSWEKNRHSINMHAYNVAHIQDDEDTFFGCTQTNGWSSESNLFEWFSPIINQVTFGVKEIQCVDRFIECTPITTSRDHQTQSYDDESRNRRNVSTRIILPPTGLRDKYPERL